MSLNSILGTATLALQAQQTATQTASNNIANAGTTGYSRQVVDLTPNTPLYTPSGAIGTGVLVQDISRVRNTMLDVNFRTQSSAASAYTTQGDILSSISNLFGEPSSTGLASTLDQFYASWGDLANSPTSSAAQSVVQERGAAVASQLNQFSSSIDQLSTSTLATANQQINDINKFTSQIAAINKQIVAAEADGTTTANDLRDARDNAIDSLSQIVPVRVIDQPNGSDNIYVGGATVVDGSSSSTFSLQGAGPGTLSLQIDGHSFGTQSPGGALGANLDALNTEIPAAKSQLDSLAAGIVTSVNTVHRTGWTAAGDAAGGANWNASTPPTGSNIDFFDPTKLTAGTMSLSAQVASSASFIAAGDVQNATGNNDVANKIAVLGDDATTMTKFGSSETTSINAFYNDLVTRTGVATGNATSSATVYTTLAQQADTQRQSVSGVSTDEELVSLTKTQQAYAAAAKIITTASAMSQTLLDMIP